MKILIFNFSNGFTGLRAYGLWAFYCGRRFFLFLEPGYLDRASCFLSDSWVGSCQFFSFSFVDVGLGDCGGGGGGGGGGGDVFLYIQF